MSSYVCLWQHLSDTEIESLANNQMGWYDFIEDGDYTEDQQDRFERADPHGEDPVDKRWEDAAVVFVDTGANTLLYAAYMRSQGAEAVILFDLASLPDQPGDEDRRPWHPLENAVVVLGYEGHADLLATVGKRNRDRTDRKRAGLVSEDPKTRMVWNAWEEVSAPWAERPQAIADVYGMEVEEVARIIFTDEEYRRWVAPVLAPETRAAIWDVWNTMDDKSTSPIKRIARDLGLDPYVVASVVFPADQFHWGDDEEPELPEDGA